MVWITAIICFLGGIGAGTYLVVSGHPWFALLVFLMTCAVQVRDNTVTTTKKGD